MILPTASTNSAPAICAQLTSPISGQCISIQGQLVAIQFTMDGSVISISPATQPSNAAPPVMMTGKRSISLTKTVLPKMISGMLIARPMNTSTSSPLAAAATPITLSRLITRSAIRMVRMATNRLLLVSKPSSPSPSGTSNWIATQNNAMLPISFR